MAKPEWGAKRTCNSCGCRFYDMTRTPITCPKCGAAVEPETPFKVRRSGVPADVKAASARAAKAAAAAIKSPDVEEEETEILDSDAEGADEDDSGLIEDTSDLGEDDDDMAEVMERVDGEADEV